MSATIFGTLEWCTLSPEEITEIVNKISVDNIYKGEDFYNTVKQLNGWRPCTRLDDSVLIWNSDDAGPIIVDGKEIGLFVHFDEDKQIFDQACTYEWYSDADVNEPPD